jgi:hypothetical protein
MFSSSSSGSNSNNKFINSTINSSIIFGSNINSLVVQIIPHRWCLHLILVQEF